MHYGLPNVSVGVKLSCTKYAFYISMHNYYYLSTTLGEFKKVRKEVKGFKNFISIVSFARKEIK